MKNTRRWKTTAITAATLAISLLLGTGTSDAMQSNSAINRARVKRAPAIRVQSFGIKNNHLSIDRAAAKRVNAVGVQSFRQKSSHMALATGLSQSTASRNNSLSRLHHSTATRQSTPPFTTLPGISVEKPLHFPGRTIRPPFERIPDPSDMRGREDLSHPPQRDMIDSRYLGDPDRSPDGYHGSFEDWKRTNANSDISNASCMWNEGTWEKVSHWGGGQGGPLVGDTSTGNWRCAPDDSNSGNDVGEGNGYKGSGGKQTSDKTTGTRETVKEAKAVKETTAKPDGKKDGPEGDDPDELGSPIAQEAAKLKPAITSPVIMRGIDMASRSDAINRIDSRSGNSGISSLSPTGTNTPRGLPHGREQRLGPNHRNRPDATGSPVSSLVMTNPMGYAASPTPDGGSNPPPGPEFNPIASATSAAAGSIMANPMGYAASPAVGTDGKDPGPAPGPEF